MALNDYTKTTYVNGGPPGISAERLNNNEDKTDELDAWAAGHAADNAKHVPYGGTTTNTGNAYSLASPAIDTYVAGLAVSFMANTDSNAAVTLNVNSKGAKAIKKANGSDVTNLKTNGVYTVRYNGTNFILQGEGASGNAIASHLLSGDTATVDAGEITGTMPDKTAADSLASAVAVQTGNVLLKPPAGYYNPTPSVGWVYIPITTMDGDIVAAKIPYLVNICGVDGTFSQFANGAVAGDIRLNKSASVNGATVNGSLVPWEWVAGTGFAISPNPNGGLTGGFTYVKLGNTTTFNVAGVYRVSMTLTTRYDDPNYDTPTTGRFKKNGVFIGNEYSTTSRDGVTYTQDFTMAVGDTLEMWGHTDGDWFGTITCSAIRVAMPTFTTNS